jgi:hypothetical protein
MSRAAIPAIALAVLLGFAALHTLAPAVYFAVLAALDIPKAAQPFSDLTAVLQAVHCAAQGVNVYANNACMGGGMYNYSPVLLRFTWLGALASHIDLAGFLLAFLFIAALAALPAPQDRAEFILRALGSVSAATIFVLERANLDAAMFVLAVAGVALCLRGAFARFAGYALFCLAAALKFYPAALLVLLLREPPRRLFILAGLLALGGLAFLARFGAGTLTALAVVPHGPPFGNCFGAIDVPLGIGLGMAATHGAKLTDLSHFHMPLAMQLVYAAMILTALWRGLANRALWRPGFTALAPGRAAGLIAGAAVACLCFFMAQNILYRAVFLLLALPGICAMAGTVPRAFTLATVMVLLMWESLFRVAVLAAMLHIAGPTLAYSTVIMVWALREWLWWWMVVQFLAILFVQAEAALAPLRLLRPKDVAAG